MAEKEESTPTKRGPAFMAALLVGLPLLYLLSTGPVGLIFEKTNGFGGLITVEGLQEFYSPIFWLKNHTFMKHPIELYWALWFH